MTFCISCSKPLDNDDIGFHKKMVSRAANEFMCVECLSAYFGLEVEKSRRIIERLRKSGCTLFV